VSGQFGESPTFRSTGGANASASRFCDIQFMATELTDGVVSLRPPRPEDAADHLAGEDHEIAKWLSGGRSTMATVQSYIRSCEENWRGDGPRRAFGIFDCATNRLIGSIEANLAFPLLEPTQANVSYGLSRVERERNSITSAASHGCLSKERSWNAPDGSQDLLRKCRISQGRREIWVPASRDL
jgi:hypothetical protein